MYTWYPVLLASALFLSLANQGIFGVNAFTTLPVGLFSGLSSVHTIGITHNDLVVLPIGVFSDLTSLTWIYIDANPLTTLAAGIFEDNVSLARLPPGAITAGASPPDGVCGCELDGKSETQAFEILCGADMSCEPGSVGYTCVQTCLADENCASSCCAGFGSGLCVDAASPLLAVGQACDTASGCDCASGFCVNKHVGYECAVCPDGTDTCNDPHMQGLRGQNIEWSGVDGGWYCLVTDEALNLHVNVRLTAPLPDDFPDRQLITGISVLSEGYSIVVEARNAYDVVTEGCRGSLDLCLADGGVRVTVNGVEVNELLRPAEETHLTDGISLTAANLPVECRQFGGDKIWARMYEEMRQGKRTLASASSTFEEWVLKFGNMAAHDWCTKYIVERDGLAHVESNHAVFKIATRDVIIRLAAGVNSQGGDGEVNWDGRVLPDLDFWQMDVGVHGLVLEHGTLSGILGETARPVLDEYGHEVMEGDEAIRGNVEDYRVSDALGTEFSLIEKST